MFKVFRDFSPIEKRSGLGLQLADHPYQRHSPKCRISIAANITM
jgi:hypothetical protein